MFNSLRVTFTSSLSHTLSKSIERLLFSSLSPPPLSSVSSSRRQEAFSKPKPIELSIVAALKSSASSTSLASGQQIHAFSIKSGLDCSNLFVRNGLINLYAKCGCLDAAHCLFRSSRAGTLDTASWNIMLVGYVKSDQVDHARKLFDEMPLRDSVSFTAMIMGLAQNGLSHEALLLFRDMLAQGVKPNEVTIATVLSTCSRSYCDLRNPTHLIVVGEIVHGLARKTGLHSVVLVGTNLVNWYAVTSNLEHARAVFDEMPEKNIVTWNAMLNGYGKAGLLDPAGDLFDRIPIKDLVSWSTMIDAYVRADMLEKALSGFCEMMRLDTDAKPNEVMLVDLVSACSRNTAFLEGCELHAVVTKAGLDCHCFVQATIIHFYAACENIDLACRLFQLFDKANISCWNALIAGFLRNGMVDAASNLFQEMPDRDVVSWSSLISGYVQSDRPDLALELFCDMMRYEVKPNELVGILSAVASCGTREQGKSVHNYVIKNTDSIPLTDNLIAALIDMYAKRGSINNALKVFSYHQHPTSPFAASPWNALISGLANHGDADMCLRIFSDMHERRDVTPNAITFIAVLTACTHAGLVSAGRQHFRSMTSVYGIEPSIKHYGCMVDLLGRAGCLEEAERLIMEMPMKADVVIWGTMLSNARTHGNIGIGEMAAERLARLEPSHRAGRVLLSNIYAESGRWDGVLNVRRQLQLERLMKVPGCSGIL